MGATGNCGSKNDAGNRNTSKESTGPVSAARALRPGRRDTLVLVYPGLHKAFPSSGQTVI